MKKSTNITLKNAIKSAIVEILKESKKQKLNEANYKPRFKVGDKVKVLKPRTYKSPEGRVDKWGSLDIYKKFKDATGTIISVTIASPADKYKIKWSNGVENTMTDVFIGFASEVTKSNAINEASEKSKESSGYTIKPKTNGKSGMEEWKNPVFYMLCLEESPVHKHVYFKFDSDETAKKAKEIFENSKIKELSKSKFEKLAENPGVEALVTESLVKSVKSDEAIIKFMNNYAAVKFAYEHK